MAPTQCDVDRETRSDEHVYQLRVVISGVSPLIWRRLLVTEQTTFADLHSIVQTVFGWAGEHLHRFTIHGREYGICYDGRPWFHDKAHQVRLGDLELRPRERFRYEYNFYAPWLVELRVEQFRPPEPGKAYPRCTGGRRAGPPEDWAGSWEFAERTQPRLVFQALLRAAEIMGQLLDAGEQDTVADVVSEADRDELAELLPLLSLEEFDRRACNKALAQLVTATTTAATTAVGSRP
jgi:Plasmid pRiA4b ORF-3-like protein